MTELKKDTEDVSRGEERLRVHVKRVADTLGISKPKYCAEFGTKTGDNYIGIIYRVLIEGEEKNGVPVKIQTIFKVPPLSEVMRSTYQIPCYFMREHVFYSDIVPVFKELLRAKNKSLENIPECYYSSPDDHEEVVCLEDLRAKGFVMRDRIKQMDLAHIKLALHALGRFHALSLALRDQKPEIFASKITTLTETLFRPEVVDHPRFIKRFKKLGDLVKLALTEEDPMYTERLSAFMKDGLTHMQWASDGNNAEPYAVLSHGDFWMNNMLFKYEGDSLEPQEIYLLDFQMPHYASPVVDITQILFCNCSQELRKKHFDELIKIYHESLSEYLSELGSDPKELFPYEALVDQLKKFSINSAGIALLLLPIFTSQGDDIHSFVSDNGDLPELEKRIYRDDFWRNTTRDTFKDLIDRNYI